MRDSTRSAVAPAPEMIPPRQAPLRPTTKPVNARPDRQAAYAAGIATAAMTAQVVTCDRSVTAPVVYWTGAIHPQRPFQSSSRR